MNENIFEKHLNGGNAKEGYQSFSMDLKPNLKQKFATHWSPQDQNKFLFKQRYVSSSRSVPQRNKRFARYKISKSLNSDMNVHNSSSDGSSFEGDKYLTRSAKIMRALNFNSSPSYYGRTKIKRSLNFNLTPSPKTFTRKSRSVRKNLSLNSSSPLPGSNKVLNFDESPNDSANSSFAFTSSESIDENQNETPSRQSRKPPVSLNHSTPNTRSDQKLLELTSFTPLMRSGLKKRIDNIVYLAATPNSQPIKSGKRRLEYTNDVAMSTPRSLFHDFHDEEFREGRPSTPENLIRLVPESMSAIKRSHKKERSSRRNDYLTNLSGSGGKVRPSTSGHMFDYKYENCKLENDQQLKVYNSEDDLSDTGSIFDYTEEHESLSKNLIKKLSHNLPEYDADFAGFEKSESRIGEKFDGRIKSSLESQTDREECGETVAETPIRHTDIEIGNRPKTPEPNDDLPECSLKVVTPENRANILQDMLKDSIKKSHRKSKGDNKKKLFSPKVLMRDDELTKQRNAGYFVEKFDERENSPVNELPGKNVEFSRQSNVKRASTPEKLNSSRLLLAQFSSVKKSHKKDKHNNILSSFLKRQEYFNMDIGIPKTSASVATNTEMSEYNSSFEELRSDLDASEEKDRYDKPADVQDDPLNFVADVDDQDTSLGKLSPSKRKNLLDVSVEDPDTTGVSCDSELQELDSTREEFQIFTPLKRRRSLTGSSVKDYFCLYTVPSNTDASEAAVADRNLSRCLTPVASLRANGVKSEDTVAMSPDDSIETNCKLDPEIQVVHCDSAGSTGRSTPRNMSTTELYCNIDSIKKSHKKNKRGSLRDGRNLNENNYNSSEENKKMDSLKDDFEISRNKLCLRNNCNGASNSDSSVEAVDDQWIDCNAEPSTSHERDCDEGTSNKTPPNCLKTKSYIRVIEQTSIKRSHKKVRDRKKYEVRTDTHELSDDGSIFGDEENPEVDQPLRDDRSQSETRVTM